MKEITSEELAFMNGKEGNPAYVAVQGKVYDVSKSRLWPKGLHMNRHPSGKDLSGDISAAPHGLDVLERYGQVGILKRGPAEELKHLPPFVRLVLERVPIARRHPHPIVVHFPIAFSMSASLFLFLHLVSGNSSFETASYYLLVLGGIASPFGVATGLITWWINYGLRWTRLIKRKVALSILLLILMTVLITWRSSMTAIVQIHPVYLILVFALTPVVFLLGYFGGLMTFPLEKES